MQPMKARRRQLRSILRLWIAVLATALLSAGRAKGQAIRLGGHRPRPQLSLFTSLSVTASPSTVNFNLVSGGAATGSSAIAVSTTYTGACVACSIVLYGYFASAANALTGGTPSSSIPSSEVFGQVSTGSPTTYTAFTQTTPYSGASGLQLYTVSFGVGLGGNRTDNLNLKIDLTSAPQQPAAAYTGTITLEAQSF
jgi:hypothetical protein